MKLVTATIRPDRVDDVKTELASNGIVGMTTIEVHGFGNQGGHKQTYRGDDISVSFNRKVQIQVVIPSELETKTIDAIIRVAKTGNIGDGKIWVSDVTRVIKVRTGEEEI